MAFGPVALDGGPIVVTGGSGFLGSFVVDRLRALDAKDILVPRSGTVDLRDADQVRRYFADVRPTLVIHLAATVGGIEANRLRPGTFFRDNMLMGVHVLEEARLAGVKKVFIAGTVCAYPKFAPIPFREDDLWNGYPEETNAPYGVAKKALLVMAQAYRREFSMNTVMVFPVNLYGPRDHFDLTTSHVIPGMIRKFLEAKERGEREVVLWGDGSPTREFLYVADAAEGIVAAATQYDGEDPVNLGSGQEISISDLARTISDLVGFGGDIRWDRSKPNGQPRRMLDTSRARERFGWSARTRFEDGLRVTIDWYAANRHAAT
jgi:GDP-L-fucose synthase